MKKTILPKRLSRKSIYKSSWINLYVDKVLMPSGKMVEKYHFLDHPKESVVVLLENDKKEILFIKSLRYTTQKIEWELVSGHIENHESILNASKREILEESGYVPSNLKLIYSYNPSNGMSNQVIHIVFGKIKDQIQKKFDTDEVKEIKWLSISDVKKLVKSKKITCGVSLMPVLLYLNDK